MNLREIYNLLLAGKTVRLGFASGTEKETFRVRLYKYKKLQERAMLQIGMIEESDVQALSFVFEGDTAILKLINKRRLRDYNVTILEDSDNGPAASCSEENVSRDLGKSQGQ